MLPLRWTAPEAIKDAVFSTASDVFSFGIVTIEVYTKAKMPYLNLRWSNAEMVRQVDLGSVVLDLDSMRFHGYPSLIAGLRRCEHRLK